MLPELIEAAFGAMPGWLEGLADVGAAEPLLDRFKIAPILPCRGGPTRIYLADTGERERWEAAVLARWPRARAFLASGPPGCRRMVDTGGEDAAIHLDDLHEHGLAEMCRVLRLPGGAVERVSRERSLPERWPISLRGPAIRALAERGGLWGLRTSGRRVTGLLWVSESAHRGDTAECTELVERLLRLPGAWHRCRRVASAAGWEAYPDALDFQVSGRVYLTLGLARPRGGIPSAAASARSSR